MSDKAEDGRLRLLLVCAHEPTLDPRILWEAEAAARDFDVSVLGFNRDDAPLPAQETISGYKIFRLPRPMVGSIHYLWQLLGVVPKFSAIPLILLLVAMSPLLLAADLLSRALRGSFRRLSHAPGFERQVKSGRLSAILGRVRRNALMRVEYILTVLRGQFAPAAAAFWQHIQDMPIKPQIIHCNDLDTLLVGILAKRHFGCGLVYDAHEFFPVSDPHGNWIDVTFFSRIERMLIRQADAVVTVNPLLAEAMREAYELDRVYSVPNAEPWVEDRPLPHANGDIDRIANGRVTFLFQGRFAPGRGIEELIDGWSAVDASRAALFLRGPDNTWRDAAATHAARLGLLDRSIYFLDAVSEDQLVSAAAEADVGIIPYKPVIINDRLSCPNKLSQYLHAGLLVLANNLPYVQSVLHEAEAGEFYDSAKSSTLPEAVRRIIDNPEALRQGRENALRFARETFNWQAHAQTFCGLYRHSVSGHAAPAASHPS